MSGTIGSSLYGPLNLVLASAGSLRSQQATLQEQSNTGMISQAYSGLAPAVSQVMDLTAVTNQNSAYTQSITQAQGKASVMQNALSQISDLVTTLSASALSITSSSPASAIPSINEQATQALKQIVSVLNTSYEGDYVFSGKDTATSPVTVTSPGGLSAAFTTANATAASTAANTVDVQIGPSTSVSLGLTYGGNAAIASIVNQLTALTTVGTATGMQTTAAALTTAGTTLAGESGQIGLIQTTMTATSTSYAASATLLASQISDLSQVDMAATVSKLQAVNTQLQTSYQVLGEMSKLNLASYL